MHEKDAYQLSKQFFQIYETNNKRKRGKVYEQAIHKRGNVIDSCYLWYLHSVKSLEHVKSKRVPEKTSISALLTMPKPLTVWITINCGKFWKRWEYPDHLTCLLRNLYAGQEATVRTGCGTTDWFQIGKGVRQGCILSPCLFNLYAEYIMRNAGLEETSWNQDCREKYQ